MKFASPSCVCFISFGFLLATICVWVWMVCSLHSVTTGSRDRANVSLIIIRGCQSGTWSQRGSIPRSTGHIMVTTRYSDQQRSKSRQNLMRLYKRWHRPITKRFIKPPLLHIESSLDRLGLLSPTHDQRSQQQIGEIRIIRTRYITMGFSPTCPC